MRKRRSNVAILFFTMAVVMIGFGIIIPILPFYVEQMGANATQLGMLMAVFSIMQFIFSPMWGTISDRRGRKPVLLLGVLGNALTMFAMGFATNYWMLFAARALAGVLSSATMPTAMAYISDSTDERARSGGMGVIGAAMGVGMVLGPGIGGWMSSISLAAPFFTGGVLSLLAMLLIVFVLPESLPAEQRVDQSSQARGPQLAPMWKALFGPLGFLFFLAFIINFALANFEGVFGLFAAHRYGYGPGQVGTVMMVIGVISAIVQGLATGPVTERFGEAVVIKVSLLASAVGFVLMLLAESYPVVLLTVGLFVISNAMLRPAIASATSKMAEGGQGMVMGLNNGYQSLGRTAGPLWAGAMFDVNLIFPYLTAAVIMLASFFATLFVAPGKVGPLRQSEPKASTD